MSSISESSSESVETLLGQAADEFTERLNRGEQPDIEEYAQLHPEIAELLRQVLPALQVMAPPGSHPSHDSAEERTALAGFLGDFRIGKEIGRGGMGIVYEAEQISLRRRVALKVLPFASTLDPKRLQRFRNEAQAAAQLHHTNIVPVFAVGSERSVHFYAMQCIEGQSLAAVIEELRRLSKPSAKQQQAADLATQRQPAISEAASSDPASTKIIAGLSTERSLRSNEFYRTVAELGLQAALALHYAHEMGVVHRDIKPANLLLDAGRNLWITDFGLAQIKTEDGLTMTGDLVGTICYMSPEQALGKRVTLDHRTDIYSLGVTLYELLTLEAAFPGHNREELLSRIAFEEPRPIRRLNKAVPAELATIVSKAIEKNPGDRYATAQELADDLRCWLEDKPIQARRPTLRQRALKWSRRHKGIVASGVLIAMILVSCIGWIGGERRARRATAEARIVEALEAAEPLLRAGNPYDPALITAVREAEAQLGGGLVGKELHQRVELSLADQAMLAKLEEIRLSQAIVKDEHFNIESADAAYLAAFEEYGIDIEAMGVKEAASRIRSRAIKLCLAAALDNWAQARWANEAPNWRVMLEIAREVDPDPWRDAFRVALSKGGNKEELEGLAVSAPDDKQSLNDVFIIAQLIQNKSPTLAVKLLRKEQMRNPADFWINEALGHTLAFTINPPHWDEAIGFLRAALAIRPQSPGIHLNLGLALQKMGQVNEAIACFREAIRLKPDYATAHKCLGTALKDEGHGEEAIVCYREASRIRMASCREAIRLHPENLWAHNDLGIALQEEGQFDEAIACYHVAIRLHPEFAAPHYNLGVALTKKSQFDEAIAYYHEAIRLQPLFPMAHTELAQALWQMGRLAESIACSRDAIRIKPDYAKAHTNLGIALGKAGQLEEAIACFREGIRLGPRESPSIKQCNLGVAFEINGQLDEAIACFREAIRIKPDNAKAHADLGSALKDKGQFNEAIACYHQAIRLKRDNATAHCSFGYALAKKGQLKEANSSWREAISSWRKAIRHEPRDAGSYNDLAELLATCPDELLRDPQEAVLLARKATELVPMDENVENNVWNTLGAALYRAGNWKAAIAATEQAMKLRKRGDAFDWLVLAMARWQLGDKEQARKRYQQAVESMEKVPIKRVRRREELHLLWDEAAALLGIKKVHKEEPLG
jgi:tetratricopeptide (TPR) repeat protein/serine/threonine protein kinase